MRLIDADALKSKMDGYWGRCQRIRKPRNGETAVFLDIKAAVEAQPTVDAVPVRHAYWIRHEDWEEEGGCGWECSECGMGSEVDYKYCMRCGARMVKDDQTD